jgi:hypothetical protein
MIDYFYLVLSCSLSIEILFRLKFISHVYNISRNAVKAIQIITSSRISDHWKEKTVPIYALIILKKSLVILGILFLIIIIFSFFTLISSNYLEFLLSFKGFLLSFFISLIFYKFRILYNE